MKIAVASGKGGTGKTMVATSLASALAEDHTIQFLDCDVEAPNAHLFLKPTFQQEEEALIAIPEIDPEICTLCGRCVEVCAFNALAKIGPKVLVFPQLCHGCGSCHLQCPVGAIRETPKSIGKLRAGTTQAGIRFQQGELTISEPMPTPVIRQLKGRLDEGADVTILDSPPGASCSVVATIHDADFLLLVTEPTPFGWHDLRQMLGVIAQTGTPAGVIINRDGLGQAKFESTLEAQSIPILMRIPYRSEIAAGLASGQLLTDLFPEYKAAFRTLYEKITHNPQNMEHR